MLFFIIIKEKSQRIKNKNFLKIGKMEMWKHLVTTLKKQKVFIDTDSNRIIKDCKKLFPWVTAYKRDKKFIFLEKNKKASPTLLMIKNFLKKYVKNENEIIVTKTQNLNPIVQSNGAFFIFKKKTFMKYNNRVGKKPYYYEISFPESVEIDTKEDLNLARHVCK